ncbi:hypothetical protein AB4Y32_35100 [Paraburkholderia phymatum]|uniref:Uncharacterized protein n=1 Tax=Paraburkholderia phymatum TaxID=148447 RepID=A0ACC6UB41_9BURK
MRNEQFNSLAAQAGIGVGSLGGSAPLYHSYPRHQTKLRTVSGRDWLQFGGWQDNWSAAVAKVEEAIGCAVPTLVNAAVESEGLRAMRVGARRVRICAPRGDRRLKRLRGPIDASIGVVTELGHSRELLRLSGAGVRHLMSVLMPVDFSVSAFALHAISQSHVHHVPVLAMSVLDDDGAEAFDLYVPCTFAKSIEEWIVAHGASRVPHG